MEIDLSDKHWDWVSKEKEIKKRILEKGDWNGFRPVQGSKCKLIIDNVEGEWNSNLKVGEEINFTIGSGDSILNGNLERCLVTMDKDELAQIHLNSVIFNVKLLEFDSPEVQECYYNLDEALSAATEHKESGIEHFKHGRIIEAYARFKRAIRILIFAGKSEERVAPMYMAVCNNIALCHLKLNRPELGIEVCNKVLEHDANNVKALLRRSTCYNMVRDFERAHADLVKVLEIEPNNPTAKEMMPPIKADIHDMNERYKNMVKKMFNYD